MHKPVNLGRLYFQRQLNVQGYQCSGDLRFVLFKHNVKPVSNVKYEERLRRPFASLESPLSLH